MSTRFSGRKKFHASRGFMNAGASMKRCTFVVVPKRWIDSYGWRRLPDHELRAFAVYYRTLGAHMGITDVPQTFEEFERTLDTYEDEHFGWDEGARSVSDATLALMGSWYPGPLAPVVRKASLALLDDALLRAFRYERPGPVARHLTRGALRLRARAVRLLPPRSTAHYARQNPEIKGYPDGYEVGELGTFPTPASAAGRSRTSRGRAHRSSERVRR